MNTTKQPTARALKMRANKAAAQAYAEKAKARVAEAIQIVETGICPQCKAGIRRNSSMTGWYQCDQFGTEGFRKDDSKPACSWQTFTV